MISFLTKKTSIIHELGKTVRNKFHLKKLLIKYWRKCKFHLHFTQSFYVPRSHKRKNDSKVMCHVALLGSRLVKALPEHVGKTEAWGHQLYTKAMRKDFISGFLCFAIFEIFWFSYSNLNPNKFGIFVFAKILQNKFENNHETH